MRKLSVHPSVCQTRDLWQNKRKLCPHSYSRSRVASNPESNISPYSDSACQLTACSVSDVHSFEYKTRLTCLPTQNLWEPIFYKYPQIMTRESFKVNTFCSGETFSDGQSSKIIIDFLAGGEGLAASSARTPSVSAVGLELRPFGL